MKSLQLLLLMVLMVVVDLNAKKFVVGEDISYYPHYNFKAKDQSGVAKEILDLFAQKQGYTFEYKPLPVKRLFNSLVKNQIDFKYPDNPFWSGDLKQGKDITYSEGVVDYTDGVFVLPSRKGRGIKGLKKLGIVRGFTAWDYLKEIKAGNIEVVENSKFIGMLKQSLRKRNDGAYGNREVIEHNLKNAKGGGQLVFDESLPHSKGTYKLSSGKYPEIIKEFNEFLKNNNKEILAIKQKYHVK